MVAQGCARHSQLFLQPCVAGGGIGEVGPELRDLFHPLLDIGVELSGAKERSGGLFLSHLQGPSQFLLGSVPLVAQRGKAANDLVKLSLAPFTTANPTGVLLLLACIGAFVHHDDGGGRGDALNTRRGKPSLTPTYPFRSSSCRVATPERSRPRPGSPLLRLKWLGPKWLEELTAQMHLQVIKV